MRRYILGGLTLAIALGLVAAGQVLAEESQSLVLAEEQAEALDELRATYHAEVWAAHRDLLRLRLELRELWAADAPDLEAILAKQAEMDRSRTRIRIARATFGVAALGLLTPEQRALHSGMIRDGRCPGQGVGYGIPASGEKQETSHEDWL